MKEYNDVGKLSFKTMLVKSFLKKKLKMFNKKIVLVTPKIRHRRGKRMIKICGKPLKRVLVEQVNFTEHRAYFYIPPKLINSELTVLYLHGGAYVFSSIDIYSGFVSRFIAELGLKAYSFNYPLAPENPYPAAVDAVIEFYKEMLKQGIKPDKIIMAGDSAGAGLALAACLRLQKEGVPQPGLLALFSPWVDLTLSGETLQTNISTDLLVTHNLLYTASDLYAGKNDRTNPEISPVFGEYRNFPPVFILAAEAELLRSECEKMHDVLERDGADVCLSVWKDAEHAFIVGMHMFPESRLVMQRVKEYIYYKCGIQQTSFSKI